MEYPMLVIWFLRANKIVEEHILKQKKRLLFEKAFQL